jgi:hypothetical protein
MSRIFIRTWIRKVTVSLPAKRSSFFLAQFARRCGGRHRDILTSASSIGAFIGIGSFA